MIEANECETGDIYEEVSTGQLFVVKKYEDTKVLSFIINQACIRGHSMKNTT